MTSSDVPIRTGLQTLDERWRAITERPEDPRSLMNVIEYGLGERRRGEVYVNRLLCYLCDPREPHGMDTDFLAAFLEEILQPFIVERAARYPHRTVGQLYDLKDDIHGLTGMSDHHDRDAELVSDTAGNAADAGRPSHAEVVTTVHTPVQRYKRTESGRLFALV